MPDSTSSHRTALLLGSTGLVGGHVLQLLTSDPSWTRVVTLGRREMPLASDTHEHYVVDFHDLDAHADLFACDAVACCLGTTIKQAGSQEAFRFVDLELPLAAATRSHTRGATAFALVSAHGADSGSRIFYNRVKGEAEDAISAVGFDSMTVLQPSLLTGEREQERTGEMIGEAVLRVFKPVLIGPLRSLRPTPAIDVALAMVDSLRQRTAPGTSGFTVLGPVAIRERAEALRRDGRTEIQGS